MLSETILRTIGSLERDLIEARVRRIYDLWSHGEIDEVISGMSADVKMVPRGQWVGAEPPAEGRAAVAARLRAFGDIAENIVSVLHEIIIDGDRAVVHRTAVGRRRDNGQRYQCDFVDFFRFRDGYMVEYSAYPDPVWVNMQMRA